MREQRRIHCLKSFTETVQIGTIVEHSRIHSIKQFQQFIPHKIHECQLLMHKTAHQQTLAETSSSWHFRSPDNTLADLGFATILLLLSSFLSGTLRAHWTELNQNRPHAWKWVRFENACPKCGVFYPPTNRGPKKHFYPRFLNLTATLTTYIFGTKHDTDNQACWQLGLLHHLKTTWNLVHKQLKTGLSFLPDEKDHYIRSFSPTSIQEKSRSISL